MTDQNYPFKKTAAQLVDSFMSRADPCERTRMLRIETSNGSMFVDPTNLSIGEMVQLRRLQERAIALRHLREQLGTATFDV